MEEASDTWSGLLVLLGRVRRPPLTSVGPFPISATFQRGGLLRAEVRPGPDYLIDSDLELLLKPRAVVSCL